MNILLYALLWLSFGLVHSITAKISVQEKLKPFLGKYYRLCYNIFAAIHIAFVLYLGNQLLSAHTFAIFLNLELLMDFIQLMGLVLIAIALMQYDLKEFLGLSPFLNKRSDSTYIEELNTAGLNGLVRHPLYTGAFIYFWGGAVSEFGTLTAILGSLYFVVGSRHEEKKLVRLYGNAYLQYQKDVPRFFPRLVRQNLAE